MDLHLALLVLAASVLLSGGVGAFLGRRVTHRLGERARVERETTIAQLQEDIYALRAEERAKEAALEDVRHERAWLVSDQQRLTKESGELRGQAMEQAAEIRSLRDRVNRDWKGELVVAVVRHRGKGGTVPLKQYRLPIEGKGATCRFNTEHPSGDQFDFTAEVIVGLPDGE